MRYIHNIFSAPRVCICGSNGLKWSIVSILQNLRASDTYLMRYLGIQKSENHFTWLSWIWITFFGNFNNQKHVLTKKLRFDSFRRTSLNLACHISRNFCRYAVSCCLYRKENFIFIISEKALGLIWPTWTGFYGTTSFYQKKTK